MERPSEPPSQPVLAVAGRRALASGALTGHHLLPAARAGNNAGTLGAFRLEGNGPLTHLGDFGPLPAGANGIAVRY